MDILWFILDVIHKTVVLSCLMLFRFIMHKFYMAEMTIKRKQNVFIVINA